MARPTVWRQSFNYGPIDPGTLTLPLELIVLQPGETLGGVWWTYQCQAGLFQTVDYPPGDTTTFAALGVWTLGGGVPDPRDPSNVDWLWWEQVIWNTAQSASTDINWMMTGYGPQQDQKAKAMRKNDTTGNQVLGVSCAVDESGSRAGFGQNVFFNVSARALIILP